MLFFPSLRIAVEDECVLVLTWRYIVSTNSLRSLCSSRRVWLLSLRRRFFAFRVEVHKGHPPEVYGHIYWLNGLLYSIGTSGHLQREYICCGHEKWSSMREAMLISKQR